jgi:hypothetical protein
MATLAPSNLDPDPEIAALYQAASLVKSHLQSILFWRGLKKAACSASSNLSFTWPPP